MNSKIDVKKLFILIFIVSIIIVGSVSLIINYINNNTSNDNLSYSASSFHVNGSIKFNKSNDTNSENEKSNIYVLDYDDNLCNISYNVLYNITLKETFLMSAGVHINTNISLYTGEKEMIQSITHNNKTIPSNDNQNIIVNHTLFLYEFEETLSKNIKGIASKFSIIIYYNIITYRSNLEKIEYNQKTEFVLTFTENESLEFLSANKTIIISPTVLGSCGIGLAVIANKRKKTCDPIENCNPYKKKCCDIKKNNMNIF